VAGKLHLPVLVFGVVEVRRLKRELEALEDYVAQAQLRTPGKQAALPRLSRLLDALATENNMNLLQAEHRAALKKFLQDTEAHAPSLHISFAADPSSAFTAKMVKWLRANIAPDALMEVGLQPTIAAGCIVRTTNKVFDLSLRNRFSDAEGLLMQALDKAGPAPEAAAVSAEAATAAAQPSASQVQPAQPVAAKAATIGPLPQQQVGPTTPGQLSQQQVGPAAAAVPAPAPQPAGAAQ
jgi:F0F1-type ATP synthase delta subunit